MKKTDAEIDLILAAFDETFPECPGERRDHFLSILRKNDLRSSDEVRRRYLMTAEQAGFGFWEYDVPKDEVLRANMWYRLRGQNPLGVVVPQRIHGEKVIHPDDLEAVRSAFQSVSEGDAPFFTVLYRARHSMRDWIWVRTTGLVTVRDDKGKPTKITGFDQDGQREILHERELREKNDLLEQILFLSRSSLINFDMHTEEVECSEEVIQMLDGGPPRRCNIRDFTKRWIHPDDQIVFWDRFLKLQTETDRDRFECRMIDGSGEVHHTLQSFVTVRDEDGRITRMTGIVLDNTKQVEKEKNLRDSQRLYRMLFDRANDAFFLLENKRIIDANRRAEELFEASSRERFFGLNPWDLGPEMQPEGISSMKKAEEMMSRADSSFPTRQCEWRARRLTGGEFDAVLSFTRQYASDDSPRLLVLRDISDQKIAARLLENYRSYLSVLDELRKTFYVRTESEIIRAFLKNLVVFFGFIKGWYGKVEADDIVPLYHAGPAKQLIDLERLPLKTPDDAPVFPLLTALQRGGPFVLEALDSNPAFSTWKDFAHRSGAVSLSALPVEVDDEAVGGLVLYVNENGIFDASMLDYLQNAVRELGRILSEKRFWDEQQIALRTAKENAELANLVKGQFLATVSHEIRIPMTAILGYTEMLDDPETPSEDYREAVRIIRNNGEYLLRILNDILDFSKIEAGKLKVDIAPASLPDILKEVSLLYSNKAAEKGLRLVIANKTPIPETIRTDAVRLKQVLLNLVSNAVKFTSKGSVFVDASWKNNGDGSGQLRIDVRDTGIGMAPATLSVLFSAFQQAEDRSVRKTEGTGLGLAISRRLAEMLGGSISVSSVPDEGSTFSVVLEQRLDDDVRWRQKLWETDRPESSKPHVIPPCSAAHPLQGRRLLLAEDSKDSRRLFEHLLTKAGAETVAVENGREALDICLKRFKARQPFDLVLMDMQMPVMDGYSAVRELRKAGYTGPIVALSAHTRQEEMNRCLEAGCDDYVVKPISRDALIKTVLKNIKAVDSGSGD